MTVQLGLGLLSIGRTWGVKAVQPPSQDAALDLIEAAYDNGISFFDTAPAYATSEAILGRALSRRLLPSHSVVIATKMGEHWKADEGTGYADHTYDSLARSIDTSLNLLGKLDILQVHKANIENVCSLDVTKALDLAATYGIKRFGASVSDLRTAEIACKSGRFEFLQFPFNIASRSLEPIFDLLNQHGMRAIVNRPFAMGALANSISSDHSEKLFNSILATGLSGVILSGTSSIPHLLANIKAFERASAAGLDGSEQHQRLL